MDNNRAHITERLMAFSRNDIFNAFSEPDSLARWWGPKGFSNSFEHFDFSEGGHWRFTMHGPDGADYPNENRFVTLAPAEKIVIEHLSEPHFFLTVTLEDTENGTLLHWEQLFDTPEVYSKLSAMVKTANEENLDRMIHVLEQKREQ